jgi:hypothetical protein
MKALGDSLVKTLKSIDAADEHQLFIESQENMDRAGLSLPAFDYGLNDPLKLAPSHTYNLIDSIINEGNADEILIMDKKSKKTHVLQAFSALDAQGWIKEMKAVYEARLSFGRRATAPPVSMRIEYWRVMNLANRSFLSEGERPSILLLLRFPRSRIRWLNLATCFIERRRSRKLNRKLSAARKRMWE